MSPGAPIEHVAKAQRFVRSATALLRDGFPDSATVDAYYAVFHGAQALLASAGIYAETHAGVRTMIGRLFVKDGPLPPDFGRDYARLMADRQTASYAVETPMTSAGAAETARDAAALLRFLLPVLRERAPETAAAVAELTAAVTALDAAAAGQSTRRSAEEG